MNKYDEAFGAFIHGLETVQLACDEKDKIDLIIGAVITLPDIPGMNFSQ